jgi:hypothetical protein
MEAGILKRMNEDQTLSFEEAVHLEYKTYGVIGFSDVSEEYMKKINRYFTHKVVMKLLLKELKSAKFWAFTLFTFTLIYLAISTLYTLPLLLVGVYLVLIVVGIIFYFKKFHKKTKELKKQDKYYFFDHVLLTNNSMLFPISYIPLMMAPHIGQLVDSETLSFSILAFLSTITVLSFYCWNQVINATS